MTLTPSVLEGDRVQLHRAPWLAEAQCTCTFNPYLNKQHWVFGPSDWDFVNVIMNYPMAV